MRFRMVSMVASALAVLGISIAARATITVPNSGSGPCGTGSCFSITNVSSGVSVGIQGTGNGIGVQGNGNAYGVLGSSSGIGVAATGTGSTGFGLYATASSSNTTGAAVFGNGQNARGVSGYSISNYAVYGSVDPSGFGTAIYGDSGMSSVALAGYFNGNVYIGGILNINGTTYSSDARLKKDVTPEVGSLKSLLALRPVSFRWKSGADGGQVQHGFIAQEVQKVLPDLVREDGRTGMLGVNYVGVVPLVVEAIQEQQRVISQQEARIAALETRLRSSTVSSTSGYTGLGIAVGLLPVGLVLGLRRRRSKKD